MSKFARLAVVFAFFGALAVPSAMANMYKSQAAATQTGLRVVSGTVKAKVLENGKVVEKTFTAGQTVPAQAVVTADSDAQLDAGGGMVVSVTKGSSFQAAHTDTGLLDIKSNGGSVKVAGFGHTVNLTPGSEVNTGGGSIQVLSGTGVTFTNAGGETQNLVAGQAVTKTGTNGDYTNLGNSTYLNITNTILSNTTPTSSPLQETKTLSTSTP
jgi:hypothetical protein